MINTVGIWGLISFLIIRHLTKRYTIEIERTFWEQKPYALNITKWDHDKGVVPNHGVGVFSFRWRNPDYISDKMENRKSHKTLRK